MTIQKGKRPRDLNQLAKYVTALATGETSEINTSWAAVPSPNDSPKKPRLIAKVDPKALHARTTAETD